MDVQSVRQRLSELSQRYDAWAAPINDAMNRLSFKVNRDSYIYDDYKRDMRQVREAALAKYDPYAEMNAYFDELCPAYLGASDAERSDIRVAVRESAGIPGALLGYVYRSATALREGAGVEMLRLGLSAALMEDCCRDFRDTFLALAELYVTAEEMGFDPRAEFKRMAQLSSKEVPPGNTSSTSSVLSGFHNYAVVRERRRNGGKYRGDE